MAIRNHGEAIEITINVAKILKNVIKKELIDLGISSSMV